MEKKKNLIDRMNLENNKDNYIRIVIAGNVDSGKSTLVGVLTKGILDNGRGSSRTKIFNYPHEQKTGRTSSIAMEIMGFDYKSKQIFLERFVQKKNKYWVDVVEKTQKIVALVDLCGHEKYLKTTVLGMVGMIPDYTLIVVGANYGLSRMTKEHLGIALALNIPIFFVVTKVDMVGKEILKKTLTDINKILKNPAVNKKPLLIEYDNDINQKEVQNIQQNKDQEETEENYRKSDVNECLGDKEKTMIEKSVQLFGSGDIAPIFQISSITNYGLKQLTHFMKLLPSRTDSIRNVGNKKDFVEFDIHEKFTVVGTGLVVSGLLKSGTLQQNQEYLLGPDSNNSYTLIQIKSIHFNRVPVDRLLPGCFGCLNFKTKSKKKENIEKKFIRKGSVILDKELHPKPVWGFKAQISVLHHSSTITEGYESVMHCGIVRQSVRILEMQKKLLRTGDKDLITFRFMYNSEYLKENSVFLLREGRTKILGTIKELIHKKVPLNQLLLSIKIFLQNFLHFIHFEIQNYFQPILLILLFLCIGLKHFLQNYFFKLLQSVIVNFSDMIFILLQQCLQY